MNHLNESDSDPREQALVPYEKILSDFPAEFRPDAENLIIKTKEACDSALKEVERKGDPNNIHSIKASISNIEKSNKAKLEIIRDKVQHIGTLTVEPLKEKERHEAREMLKEQIDFNTKLLKFSNLNTQLRSHF